MKVRIQYYCSLILLMSNAHAMEDWQKAPGQRLGGAEQRRSPTQRPTSPQRRGEPATPSLPAQRSATATPTAIPSATQSYATMPATAASIAAQQPAQEPGSIVILSQQSEQPTPEIIRPDAIAYSNTLKTMVEISDADDGMQAPFDYPEQQLHFVANLLNFIAEEKKNKKTAPPQHALVEYIIDHTHNFSTISFADTFMLINFFGIQTALDALISIQQPVQLPKNKAEQAAYNQQHNALFIILSESHDRNLLQLLGRMLYPGCLEYPEIAAMVDAMPQEFKRITLGAYMMTHPKLYLHRKKIIADIPSFIESASTPDRTMLASISKDEKNITLLNTKTHNSYILNQPNEVKRIALSSDGTIIALADDWKTIQLWNTQTGSLIRTIETSDGAITSITLSPDGRLIAATAIYSKNIQIWDTQTGALIHTIKTAGEAWSVAFSPDGKLIATSSSIEGQTEYQTGSNRSVVQLWNTQTYTLQQESLKISDTVFQIIFSPDSTTIAAVMSTTSIINIWNIQTNVSNFIQINRIRKTRFNSDGTMITSMNMNGEIFLINTQTGDLVGILREPDREYSYKDYILNPNNESIVATAYDGSTVQWGYTSLQEALQASLVEPSTSATPGASATAAAITAPSRSVIEAEKQEPATIEEKPFVRADPRFDSLGRPVIPMQEQQPAPAVLPAEPLPRVAQPVVIPVAPVQPAPRRGVLGTIGDWWYGKKR